MRWSVQVCGGHSPSLHFLRLFLCRLTDIDKKNTTLPLINVMLWSTSHVNFLPNDHQSIINYEIYTSDTTSHAKLIHSNHQHNLVKLSSYQTRRRNHIFFQMFSFTPVRMPYLNSYQLKYSQHTGKQWRLFDCSGCLLFVIFFISTMNFTNYYYYWLSNSGIYFLRYSSQMIIMSIFIMVFTWIWWSMFMCWLLISYEEEERKKEYGKIQYDYIHPLFY